MTSTSSSKYDAVAAELVASESTYVRLLSEFVSAVIEPILAKPEDAGLTPEVAKFFPSNLVEIMTFHRDHVLAGLESTQRDMFEVLGAALENIECLYTQYVTHYKVCDKAFAAQQGTNEVFKRFLQTRLTGGTMQQSYASYLIMPVQRVPRYLLLLKELRKHVEAGDERAMAIDTLMSGVDSVTKRINEAQRHVDLMADLKEIEVKLKNAKPLFEDIPQLDEPHRVLLRQGDFAKKTTSKRFNTEHTRHVYLFNDLLLWCNPNTNKYSSHLLLCNRPRASVKPYVDKKRHGIDVHAGKQRLLLLAPHGQTDEERVAWMSERDGWIKDLKTAVTNIDDLMTRKDELEKQAATQLPTLARFKQERIDSEHNLADALKDTAVAGGSANGGGGGDKSNSLFVPNTDEDDESECSAWDAESPLPSPSASRNGSMDWSSIASDMSVGQLPPVPLPFGQPPQQQQRHRRQATGRSMAAAAAAKREADARYKDASMLVEWAFNQIQELRAQEDREIERLNQTMDQLINKLQGA